MIKLKILLNFVVFLQFYLKRNDISVGQKKGSPAGGCWGGEITPLGSEITLKEV
jgi:hypothetical protein